MADTIITETIKMTEFSIENNPTGKEFLIALSNNIEVRILLDDLITMFNLKAAAPIPIHITDQDEGISDGIYTPIEEGLYVNLNPVLEYDKSEGLTFFIKSEGIWYKNVTPINFNPIGIIEEDNPEAVSGGEVFSTFNPFIKLPSENLDFVLTNGRVNMTSGGTDMSTFNWLSTEPIMVLPETIYTIEGYGNAGLESALGTRIVCRQGTTVMGSITGGYGLNSFTFTTLPGTDNIKINIEAIAGVANDIPDSPFWNTFKIIKGESYIRAEKIKGNIITPQITNLEGTVEDLEDDLDFINTLFYQETDPYPIVTTNGYTTRGGTVAGSSTGYRRTSVSSAASMAEYDGSSTYSFTGIITGEDIAPNVAGVCYYDETFTFLGYECELENNYQSYILNPPTGTKYMACCSYGSEPIIGITETYAKTKPNTNTDSNVFYVSKLGNDTNNGSASSPYLTINKAIERCVGKDKSKVLVMEGIYRETLNFAGITSEEIEIVAEDKKVVDIFGSDTLSGFTKTSGRTNVYETTLTTAIPSASRMGQLIFEHGRNSEIINDNERLSLQRGLSHRLPFTAIKPVASVALVDSTPNSFYHDTGIDKVYIHTLDSSNPASNEFSYEIIRRSAVNSTYSSTNSAKLILQNINFKYTTNVVFRQFKMIERYFCSSMATLGDGAFVDNTQSVISYNDEAVFANGDGINGHMSGVPGSINLDQREGVQNGIYFNPWCHDNFDDGLSFHERGNTTINGGYMYRNRRSSF